MRSRTGIERTQISPRRGRSSLRIGGVILLVLFLAAGAGLGSYRHHNLHFDDGRMDALHDAGFVEKQAKTPEGPVLNYAEGPDNGPGTRLTVFLNGCGLRCLYCHNPDTFLMKDGAPVSSDEILGRIRRYRRIFRATGGGITISGGEAMMQPEFVRRIFHGAKEMGVHTCLDTSGFLGVNCDDDILDHLDLCLLDVKSGLPDTYKRVTSGELQPTIDFGDRLAARGTTRVWIRFVLVPGLTDDWDNIHAIGEIISKWKNVIDRVEVLPFHQMGRDKWHSLGLKYELEETKPPTPEATEEVRDYFRSLGFEVH